MNVGEWNAEQHEHNMLTNPSYREWWEQNKINILEKDVMDKIERIKQIDKEINDRQDRIADMLINGTPKGNSAVEYLIEKYEKFINSENGSGEAYFYDQLVKDIEQAKAMEQQQMKEMYLRGIENYDPTFKRKSQWTSVDNSTKLVK